VTSDEAVQAALKVWFGRRGQQFGAGQEAVMRAALEAAMEVEWPAIVAGATAAALVLSNDTVGETLRRALDLPPSCAEHGPPPTSPSGVSRNPRTGAR